MTLIHWSIFPSHRPVDPSPEGVAGLSSHLWAAEAGLNVQINSQLHSVR